GRGPVPRARGPGLGEWDGRMSMAGPYFIIRKPRLMMESSEIQPAKMMGCDPRLPESRPGAGRIPSAAGAASIPGSLAVAGAILGRSEDQVFQRGIVT